jgi:hypothetical protein
MRKLVGLALGAALSLTTLAAVPVSAGPADFIRNGDAFFFDGVGNLFLDPDQTSLYVDNNNKKGTWTFRAHGTVPGGFVVPDKAVHWDFASTGSYCGLSTTWHGTVTPAGNWSLICHGVDSPV